jgi:TonB family protein
MSLVPRQARRELDSPHLHPQPDPGYHPEGRPIMLATSDYVERTRSVLLLRRDKIRGFDAEAIRRLNIEPPSIFDIETWSPRLAWRAMPGAMSKVELLHAVVAEPTGAASRAPVGEAVLVDVVVLSADDAVFEAARAAVGDRNPVWRARSADEAADLLLTGRCGVLLLDLAAVSARADTLVHQILEQFPHVIVCVAGTRDDEPLLVPLITEGLVYRFMHKPCSARRAGMFLQAAIRRHVEVRAGSGGLDSLKPLLMRLARSHARLPRWYLVALAMMALLITVPLFTGGRPRGTDPPTQSSTTPVATPAAMPGATATRRADPVLARARAALQAGRLESPEGRNALDLFQAVLLAEPTRAEAQQGLSRTIELLLAEATRDNQDGRRQDAEHLLQRVLSVQPDNAQARALVRRMTQLDTPSRQLQREQVVRVQTPVQAQAQTNPRMTSTPASPRAVEPAATTTHAVVVAPAPVYRPAASSAHTSAASPATAAPRPRVATNTKPYPDPLVPRTVNRGPASKPASRPRTRVFGAPIDNHLPKAGLASASLATLSSPAPAAGPPPANVAAPRAPAPVPPSPRVASSSDVVAADELDRVASRDPVYPREALRTRTRGWVELEFTITATGNVGDIQVIDAEPTGVFERAALDALAAWRFRPRIVNGQPVSQRSMITMRFDVDD